MTETVIEQSALGHVVEVQQGDAILIRLEENPTTGYRWDLQKLVTDVLIFQSTDYVMAPGVSIGGGGTRSFRFLAQKAGMAKVQLQLRRAWEPEEKFLDHFEVTLSVHPVYDLKH